MFWCELGIFVEKKPKSTKSIFYFLLEFLVIFFLLHFRVSDMMLSVSPSVVMRSSLEEMLESIKQRDEKPKDIPPALPFRPISKARLPSARRSLPDNFKIGEAASPTASSAAATPTASEEKDGKKRDRYLCMEDKDVGFQSSGNGKLPKLVPVEEEEKVVSDQLTEESISGGNADFVLQKGFKVWCQMLNGLWKSGKIEKASIEDALITLSDGNVVTVPWVNILPANPAILEGIDDLVQLSFLNEPSALHNLQYRYHNNRFYTKAGRVLLAINPFKNVQLHQKEFKSRENLMVPHVYATAEYAFNEMMRDEENQSIIVSGESGAGKTEIANRATQYLAALGGANEMKNKIIQINHILEALGNAKTLRNHNASRFRKLIEIHFSAAGKFCGAKIETLLLDKSRIVQLAKGERSYHIFYQLCSGAPASLKERLNLRTPKEYDYLNRSDCFTIDDLDDAQRFHMLMEALEFVQISKDDQEILFSMLSAVLWLGNISFKVIDSENHVEVIANEAVTSASKLMGCNIQELMLTLSTRRIHTGNNNIVQKLTQPQAIDARDTLAKTIYVSLFDWLVKKLNKSLEIDKQKSWRSISVLDIYGFESFQKNSLEQLCINYTNERLHQYFNRHLFKLEQEEYAREGIDWSRVDFEDNQECLNLFEQESCGLLSLLEEESNSTEATDVTLTNKLTHHLSSGSCFKAKKNGTFSVCHYAGEVLYDTSGLLDKNKDSLHSDCVQLLSSSTYKLPLFVGSNMLTPSQMPMSPVTATNSRRQGVGLKFKDQLFKLMQQLENTKPHFICCIKPNNKKLPGKFEEDLVLEQLRSSGVLEAVRISRLGYPTRMTHLQFVRRYGLLVGDNVGSPESLNMSVAILQQFNIHPDVYRVGYTKLFFRPEQVATLEDARKRMLLCVVKVQKCVRGHLARRDFLELAKRRSAQQSSDPARNTAKENCILVKNSTVVPSEEKCMNHIASETLHDRQWAVIVLQSVIRGWLVRKRSRSMLNVHKSNDNLPDKSTQERKDFGQEHPHVPASVVEELRREVLEAKTALKQKEDENAALQQRLKLLQIRWLENDVRVKSMEETWQKQMTSLQRNLTAAKSSLAVNEAPGQNRKPDASPFRHNYDSEDTVSAPRTPERHTPTSKSRKHISVATPSRESNSTLNAIDQLAKELEQRKQVFNNDVKILVEVKSGRSASTRYSSDDLGKVKKNFEAWKKEFKAKLKEAKKVLKRSNPEAEKARKPWWGKLSSRKM